MRVRLIIDKKVASYLVRRRCTKRGCGYVAEARASGPSRTTRELLRRNVLEAMRRHVQVRHIRG